MKIEKVLIANRGEIARRVIRTLKKMNIASVAIYSDSDRNAPHVLEADEAVCVGAGPSAESYLRQDLILKYCKELGVDGIHPGYGFLSENADFAQEVIDAGLIWVGPKPESIRAMGLKDAAKTGKWAMFQNVHLMQTWMKTFERQLEIVLEEGAHDERGCRADGSFLN